MAEGKEISGLSGLCASCGMCCNGVLFDFAPVEPEETERLKALGFAVDETQSEARTPRFAQPCIQFKAGLCSIYDARPKVCSLFRCELYKAVEKGETPLPEALIRVSEARGWVKRIWPMLADASAGAAGKQWGSLLRAWQSKAPEERAERSNAELVLSLTVLNQLLDRYFRRDKDRQLRIKNLED